MSKLLNVKFCHHLANCNIPTVTKMTEDMQMMQGAKSSLFFASNLHYLGNHRRQVHSF